MLYWAIQTFFNDVIGIILDFGGDELWREGLPGFPSAFVGELPLGSFGLRWPFLIAARLISGLLVTSFFTSHCFERKLSISLPSLCSSSFPWFLAKIMWILSSSFFTFLASLSSSTSLLFWCFPGNTGVTATWTHCLWLFWNWTSQGKWQECGQSSPGEQSGRSWGSFQGFPSEASDWSPVLQPSGSSSWSRGPGQSWRSGSEEPRLLPWASPVAEEPFLQTGTEAPLPWRTD